MGHQLISVKRSPVAVCVSVCQPRANGVRHCPTIGGHRRQPLRTRTANGCECPLALQRFYPRWPHPWMQRRSSKCSPCHSGEHTERAASFLTRGVSLLLGFHHSGCGLPPVVGNSPACSAAPFHLSQQRSRAASQVAFLSSSSTPRALVQDHRNMFGGHSSPNGAQRVAYPATSRAAGSRRCFADADARHNRCRWRKTAVTFPSTAGYCPPDGLRQETVLLVLSKT